MNTGLDSRISIYTDTDTTVCNKDLNIASPSDSCGQTDSTSTVGNDHNKLSGLQGGIPTERYHLARDEYDSLVGANAPSGTNVVATIADLTPPIDPTLFIQSQNSTVQTALFRISGQGLFENSNGNKVILSSAGFDYTGSDGHVGLNIAGLSLSTSGTSLNGSASQISGSTTGNNWILNSTGINTTSGNNTLSLSSSALTMNTPGNSISLQPSALTLSATTGNASLSFSGIQGFNTGSTQGFQVSPSGMSIVNVGTNVLSISLLSDSITINPQSGKFISTSNSFRVNHTPVVDTDVLRLVDIDTIIPLGTRNQTLFCTQDSSRDYYAGDEIEVGQFIRNSDELSRAFSRGQSSQEQIFNSFKRYSHGGDPTLPTTPTIASNNIPGIPIQTNSWSYDSTTNIISSTENTGSAIGFYSKDKFDNYVHTATISATDGSVPDNDRIGLVIAFYEDPSDLVLNTAYGLNPSDFTWPINTVDQYIPNQHSLVLYRNRDNVTRSYFIAYNYLKLDQRIISNGSTLSGLYNTLNNWSGNSVDIKVIRQGDIIKVYTSQFSDAPGGKGSLGFELILDLNSDSDLFKFKGKQPYGYSAQSQVNSEFSNISFSESANLIYDLRNGDVYNFGGSGYVLDTTKNYFTDIGIKRELYNPYEDNLLYLDKDSNIHVLNNKFVVILGSIDDNAGVRTSAQLTTAYPSAVAGQQVISTSRVYERNTTGWFYSSKTDCS